MTFVWMEGMRRMTARNADAVITSACVGCVVRTVAVRGPLLISAISPRKSPEPSVLTFLPRRSTSAAPSTMITNSRPVAPSFVRRYPAGTTTSSAVSASSRSSRREQSANSGTLPISATFVSFPSIRGFSGAGSRGSSAQGYHVSMAKATDALIVDAVRSAIGKKNGTLAHIRGDELSAQVVNALVARNGVDPAEIEDVQWGCVTQVDEQAWNIGRNVAPTAGWPVCGAGTTVP